MLIEKHEKAYNYMLKKDHFIQREIPNKPQLNFKGNCSKGNSKCISVQFKGKLFKGKFQMYQICSNLPIRFKEKEKCIVISANQLLLLYYRYTELKRNGTSFEPESRIRHTNTIRKNPRFQSNIYA